MVRHLVCVFSACFHLVHSYTVGIIFLLANLVPNTGDNIIIPRSIVLNSTVHCSKVQYSAVYGSIEGNYFVCLSATI